MIQWLTHKYFTCFISGWISILEQISWMNDSMTNTFFKVTCRETMQSTNIIWSTSYFQKGICSILITTIDINVFIWIIKLLSQYFCDNMNDCKTEIILCSWKDCLWSCFLPKHGKCRLSVSEAVWKQIWMFRYDCFKGLIDMGESLSFKNGIAWVFESRSGSFKD